MSWQNLTVRMRMTVREHVFAYSLTTCERCNRAARLAMRLGARRLADIAAARRIEILSDAASGGILGL